MEVGAADPGSLFSLCHISRSFIFILDLPWISKQHLYLNWSYSEYINPFFCILIFKQLVLFIMHLIFSLLELFFNMVMHYLFTGLISQSKGNVPVWGTLSPGGTLGSHLHNLDTLVGPRPLHHVQLQWPNRCPCYSLLTSLSQSDQVSLLAGPQVSHSRVSDIVKIV